MHKTLITIVILLGGYIAYKNNMFPEMNKYINQMINLPQTIMHDVNKMKK